MKQLSKMIHVKKLAELDVVTLKYIRILTLFKDNDTKGLVSC